MSNEMSVGLVMVICPEREFPSRLVHARVEIIIGEEGEKGKEGKVV